MKDYGAVLEASMPLPTTKTRSIRFPVELIEELETLAKINKRSFNNQLEVIAIKHLKDIR